MLDRTYKCCSLYLFLQNVAVNPWDVRCRVRSSTDDPVVQQLTQLLDSSNRTPDQKPVLLQKMLGPATTYVDKQIRSSLTQITPLTQENYTRQVQPPVAVEDPPVTQSTSDDKGALLFGPHQIHQTRCTGCHLVVWKKNIARHRDVTCPKRKLPPPDLFSPPDQEGEERAREER